MMLRSVFWVSVFLFLVSCAPPIYIIDRSSIMDMESGGSFPELEQGFLVKSEAYGPKIAPRDKVEKKGLKKRSYNILQGDLIPNEKK